METPNLEQEIDDMYARLDARYFKMMHSVIEHVEKSEQIAYTTDSLNTESTTSGHLRP